MTGTDLIAPEHIAASSLTRYLSRDPSDLGFPPMLPLELALRTGTPRELCKTYGISKQQWEEIRNTEAFISALKDAMKLVHVDGYGFKAKAKLQSEELLKTSWVLIHSADTPPAVKADLIKWTAKVAGYEPSQTANQQAGLFQININM